MIATIIACVVSFAGGSVAAYYGAASAVAKLVKAVPKDVKTELSAMLVKLDTFKDKSETDIRREVAIIMADIKAKI